MTGAGAEKSFASTTDSALPCTTTWALVSLWGLSSTGLKSLWAGTPQATACNA
ncbi:hypothetical protein MBH78_20255 [Oceanimonas sp. NS1]|nr:hypothetical protein [Oceanimonas sp. NS1]